MMVLICCLFMLTLIVGGITLLGIKVISFCELDGPFRKWVRSKFIKEDVKEGSTDDD